MNYPSVVPIDPPIIYAIAVPPAVTRRLDELAVAGQLTLQSYATTDVVVELVSPNGPGCILLWAGDQATPAAYSLRRLLEAFRLLPVVVVVSDGCRPEQRKRLNASGAFDILESSMPPEDLVEVLSAASLHHLRRQQAITSARHSAELMDRTTKKEREVLDFVIQGAKNKEIAVEVGITVRAVEDRRFRLMKKVSAGSIAELITIAVEARLYNLGFLEDLSKSADSAPRSTD